MNRYIFKKKLRCFFVSCFRKIYKGKIPKEATEYEGEDFCDNCHKVTMIYGSECDRQYCLRCGYSWSDDLDEATYFVKPEIGK